MDQMREAEKSRVIEQNRAYHDQAADSYDRTMEQDPTNKVIRQKVREKLYDILPSGRVLDFGGGTGLDLKWLTDRPYDVLFCEPSIGMREKAIHYNNTILRRDGIIFLEGGATDFSSWQDNLPFSPPTDGVLSNFGALNYIPDISLLFNNMARVVKTGGHFLLLVLDLPFKKRWKWHRRNAVRSFVFRSPFVMYIPYEGAGRQTVFVHSVKEIKEASAPYFSFCSNEPMETLGFTLIHLIRK